MKRLHASSPKSAGLVLLILIFLAPAATADQILLRNGDRLTGTVVKVENGILTLKTDYAEKLEIRAEAVQSIDTEQPVDVRLQGGELLRGALQSVPEGLKIKAGEERGETTVAWPQIASINVPPPPPWTWNGNLFLGAMQQSGNTDRTSASFGGEATRRSPRDRFNLSLLYNYAEEDGELTTRDTYGAIKYDYFFTEKFYAYLGVEMLKDKFKDLNLRTIVGPGDGYQIWDDEIKALAQEAGIAYFSEDRVAAHDDHWFTARLGARFRYKLSEQVTFSDNLTLYPSLESGGEFTSRNEATLITTLAGPWSLRLANIWEHDSDPAEGIKKDDTKTSVNLQYSF
jgi:putative salt-induced outer membrane protein YdiY/small nuclear ribonucleoprotein (snRNP)-like protein